MSWSKIPKPMYEDGTRRYKYGEDFVDTSGSKRRVKYGDNFAYGGGMHYRIGPEWTKIGSP